MGSETDKLLSYIEKTNSNLEWLHFLLLFKLIGVDPRNATLAVPFLHHDTDLGIPGIRKIALNNESGGNSPGFKFILGDVSEQIRLPNKSVDLLVVNHGVVLYEWTKQLDHSNNYPAEVYRVTQPNGVLWPMITTIGIILPICLALHKYPLAFHKPYFRRFVQKWDLGMLMLLKICLQLLTETGSPFLGVKHNSS